MDAKQMIEKAIAAAMDGLKIAAECDELYRLNAQVYRKAFDSLVAVGFTEGQAMLIVSRQGAAKLS